MENSTKTLFWIKFAYWIGIVADGIWAIGLFVPAVFGILTGNPSFSPDWELRSVMTIAGILMTAWTILLIWGVQSPVERRFVILLTALIVLGLFMLALINVLNGKFYQIWILVKTSILFVFMTGSYILSCKLKN